MKKNCVHQNHIVLELKSKKNMYTIIVQLSFGYYKNNPIIPLKIRGINKQIAIQKIV